MGRFETGSEEKHLVGDVEILEWKNEYLNGKMGVRIRVVTDF